MLKCGIITFHRAINYGALFQTIALFQTLKNQGHEVIVVDYRCKKIERDYYIIPLFKRKTIKSVLVYFLCDIDRIKKSNKFYNTLREKCKLSQSFDKETIYEGTKSLDVFIVGSDQIWNIDRTGADGTYFLDFIKGENKKWSYAASFGKNDVELNETQVCKLKEFKMCSVREMTGIDILNRFGIINNRQDIDPTFLLNAEQWERLFDFKIHEGDYIFVYYTELTEGIISFVERLQRHTGLLVKYVGSSFGKPFRCRCKFINAAGPIEFIHNLAGAKFIVTNSFHGAALSINFHKNVFINYLEKTKNVNVRLQELVGMFGLENRVVDGDRVVFDSTIDYDIIDKRLKAYRECSLAYLSKIG